MSNRNHILKGTRYVLWRNPETGAMESKLARQVLWRDEGLEGLDALVQAEAAAFSADSNGDTGSPSVDSDLEIKLVDAELVGDGQAFIIVDRGPEDELGFSGPQPIPENWGSTSTGRVRRYMKQDGSGYCAAGDTAFVHGTIVVYEDVEYTKSHIFVRTIVNSLPPDLASGRGTFNHGDTVPGYTSNQCKLIGKIAYRYKYGTDSRFHVIAEYEHRETTPVNGWAQHLIHTSNIVKELKPTGAP